MVPQQRRIKFTVHSSPVAIHQTMNTDVSSHSPESLLQAFSAAEYRVRIAGREFVVRPGCRQRDLDTALGNRRWAIVTACNPQARRMADSDNRQRQQELCKAIGERGLETHPAVNRDPAGTWPDETSVLIVEGDLATLDSLAEAFGQAAIVTGGSAEVVKLRLYGRNWPDSLPEWAGRAE